MTRDASGRAAIGGDDSARWWDELLEEVAGLAGDGTTPDPSSPAHTGWGRARERLAGVLSRSDPGLAAAAQVRAGYDAAPPPPTPAPTPAPAAGPAEAVPLQAVSPRSAPAPRRAAPAARARDAGPRRADEAAPAPVQRVPAVLQSRESPGTNAAEEPAVPPRVDVGPPPAPRPSFIPAAPGTIIELPDRGQLVVAPWERSPGYVAPTQQTVATDMPTIGIPLAAGFVEAMTSRGYRPHGVRLHARVRILWERLLTRHQEERLVAGALVVGMVAGAVVILVLIYAVRLLFQ